MLNITTSYHILIPDFVQIGERCPVGKTAILSIAREILTLPLYPTLLAIQIFPESQNPPFPLLGSLRPSRLMKINVLEFPQKKACNYSNLLKQLQKLE
jgi:hypothetical protein